jgi:hypothetical protein
MVDGVEHGARGDQAVHYQPQSFGNADSFINFEIPRSYDTVP